MRTSRPSPSYNEPHRHRPRVPRASPFSACRRSSDKETLVSEHARSSQRAYILHSRRDDATRPQDRDVGVRLTAAVLVFTRDGLGFVKDVIARHFSAVSAERDSAEGEYRGFGGTTCDERGTAMRLLPSDLALKGREKSIRSATKARGLCVASNGILMGKSNRDGP
jgi:hypothetical protein